MKKEFLIIICILICFNLSIAAAQNPPHRICCRAVYRAGAALGAAASLSAFFDNQDTTILANLDSAAFWIEASNAFCQSTPPVWANWEDLAQSLDYIAYHLKEYDSERELEKARSEAAFKLKKYYFDFGKILLYRNYVGTLTYPSTCSEKYFKLGFALKYAHISFGYAVSDTSDASKRATAHDEGIEYLERALRILNELPSAVPVWGKCVELWHPSLIKADIEDMLSKEYDYSYLKNTTEQLYEKANDAFDGVPSLDIGRCPGTDRVLTEKGHRLIKSAKQE